jgi:hypothetical protein
MIPGLQEIEAVVEHPLDQAVFYRQPPRPGIGVKIALSNTALRVILLKTHPLPAASQWSSIALPHELSVLMYPAGAQRSWVS